MTIEELLIKVNDQKQDIYDISEAAGFSKSTLRKRLIEKGYVQVKNGNCIKFEYRGDLDEPPIKEIIDYRKRRSIIKQQDEEEPITEKLDLFTAFLQLPNEEKKVTASFKTDEKLVERMKEFIKMTSLPMGRLYSLAVHEFLEKYEPQLKKTKGK